MGHRVLEGEQTLLRIFLGESDQWHGRPLHIALLERLRQRGAAGVTVLRGIAGFGARSVVHTTHILRLSEDLPIVIELVDTPEHVERLLPHPGRDGGRGPGDDGEGPGGEVRTRHPRAAALSPSRSGPFRGTVLASRRLAPVRGEFPEDATWLST